MTGDSIKHPPPFGQEQLSEAEAEILAESSPLRRVLSFYLRSLREKREREAYIKRIMNDTYKSNPKASS